MARFAQKQVKTDGALSQLNQEYLLGHNDKVDYVYKSKKGLSQAVVRQLSARKKEPAWMLDKRLKALEIYDQKPLPTWGGNLKEIDFKEIYYYLESMDHTSRTWDDVPDAIKKTFDKIGVPEAERAFLAGVGGQYDSTVVYHNLLTRLKKKGVVFLGMDDGLKQYPQLVKEYFGKIIPTGDNKLAALNTATWSGGSFIYVPKGVDVDLPLQAYFRINAEKAGQFERTLIIADEGSKVHYVEGCFIKGTPIRTNHGYQPIESVQVGDQVVSHKGVLKSVYKAQKRKHDGTIYEIEFYGDSTTKLTVTDEHPFLYAKRDKPNDRNKTFGLKWGKPGELQVKDYLAMPRLKENFSNSMLEEERRIIKAKVGPVDDNYLYLPIKSIKKRKVKNLPVYNFSVEKDESYTAGGVVVHNCSAPQYSSGSLHAAVVEIFVKKGARVQYTTLQNWYKNVYNLVTKRAWVEEEATMQWIDINMGSKLTMKYPSCILAGRKAKGETLSVALAAADQHQDAGAKMIHLAPETTSRIISKSISKDGGRATYRGMVQINKGAYNSRSKVVCNALILDEKSRSDTYPTNKIMENRVTLEHEATVSKVGEEQLFYLMSRGMEEHEAEAMIVQGFLEPVVKEIPMEYAVEMNRLIELEMEGSVG